MEEAIHSEPFVSVLTPVYNGEKYLEECIQSVLSQTYSHWEYVLVDNQSSDNSLQIMEKYAANDKRIRVHNNEAFLPQMKNLNHAFHQISPESKYCKVVHADDWLFPDCITRMVKVMEEHPSVGIVSAYRLDDRKVGLDGLPYPSNFNTGMEIARRYLMCGTSYFGSPSSILLRSDLIRKREKVYEESLLATDTPACIDFLQESDFGFVHQVLTFTRRHEESMSNMQAKENHAFLRARLYCLLTYGPHFLSDDELKKSLNIEMKKYYIILARDLFRNQSLTEFRKQRDKLWQLGIEFKTGRFFKNLIRESVLQASKAVGIRLRRAS
ncbi:glycosyltransferase family 2 protein [Fodinibius sediminis]|uniref:Glycosyltransferase involved in cell wall bisynthesis n=1 Tax=Fodinibius sediminis TaxID=1214077 RepID=A0A521B3K9_9BACT|nr:glycosyltransferase family A protein [Fodinibius sediminis]SMO41704.1 Glycosyltransferase involved in cell wall bisynthesis [Fodinibius sediminis]